MLREISAIKKDHQVIPRPFSLALVMLAAAAMFSSSASAQSMQVMTWNIRYDNAGDGENRWRNRKDWVAEIVLREKIDVAGFQEVLAGQFKDLQERLPEMSSYGVGRDDGKDAGEMVPIFYRTSRFELLEKGTFWLSTTPEQPSRGWDAALPRITGWVKLKDRESQEILFVLNAHFDHRGNTARRESAALILKQVREKFAAHPVIFVGDLNSLPDSPAYDTLIGKGNTKERTLRDAYAKVKERAGPDSTWNGFQKIAAGSRIDYLFATEQIALESLRTLTDQRDGRFPSDHLPIVVKLELRK